MREFNSTGPCVPRKHYMVDISGRVAQMRAMVERGDYFCVNRARQYGKTTVLAALENDLSSDYTVVGLDFQALSHADFATESAFVSAFAREVLNCAEYGFLVLPCNAKCGLVLLRDAPSNQMKLSDLFATIVRWISESDNPVVLIIDEVDSATNNQVFLDFLAQLRLRYIMHAKKPSVPSFQSVVLAGVTDVKHLKAKIRPDGQKRLNSPWNIAADFDVNLGFGESDVAGMLAAYEADHKKDLDIGAVAAELVAWTGGYPFLVSRLCQLVDARNMGWNRNGVNQAVRELLGDDDVSLFESLMGQLETQAEIKDRLRATIMLGEEIDYSPYDETQKLLRMYGFAKVQEGKLVVANRIFETLLCDYFLAEERDGAVRNAAIRGRNHFVREGRLNMRAVLEGFRRTYEQVFGPLEERFHEKDGRELFLLYLKPIINGTGNYYIEAQTRDQTRTDVVVDYAGEQFVVELKIWHGPRYNEEGEEQLRGYLEYFGLSVGYMLSFNFNKHKESGLKRVGVGDKIIWEETL